jgi:hypothetical protein
MPVDNILFIGAVIVLFAVFAVTLAWVNQKTG